MVIQTVKACTEKIGQAKPCLQPALEVLFPKPVGLLPVVVLSCGWALTAGPVGVTAMHHVFCLSQ